MIGFVGRALRRAIALVVLAAIRGRRVLIPLVALLAAGYLVLAFVPPVRALLGLPGQGGTTSGRGVGPVAAATARPGSEEAAIQQVIQRADAEQAQAIAARDPSSMRDTSTAAYYQDAARVNQDLIDGGVARISLLGVDWGPIAVSGDAATATADETWATDYADGTTEESHDRNVYGLVKQNGVWLIQSDEHPDAGSATPAAGAGPAGRRPEVTPTPAETPQPASPPGGVRAGKSSNWSGYAATGGSFTAVTGTWIVPRPAATDAAGESAAWVGIGGEHSRDLIQAGTEEIVVGPGRVRYEAWIEMLPRGPRQVPLSVHAGDAVAVEIAQQAAGSWRIAFKNETTGASHEETVQYDSSLSSAEWIEEAPGGGRRRGITPLDDFGTVTFRNGSTVRDGQRLSLAGAGASPITLIDRNDRPLAEPSELAADGSGFTVTRTSAVQTAGTPRRR